MRKALKVLNAYIHDFAVALWAASLFAIYRLNMAALPSDAVHIFFNLKREFFFIGAGSLLVIILTGIGRTLAYSRGAYGEESEVSRKWILIVKHILGFILYGAGTYWQYVMAYGT